MEDQKVVDSKFRLVILASKRAKQLLRGGKKKVDMNAENPLSVALEEIKQGKIDYEIVLNEDEHTLEAGEETGNDENEVAEESLSGSELDVQTSGEETGSEEDGEDEAVVQGKDS